MGRRFDKMKALWRWDRTGFLLFHAGLVAVMGVFGLLLWGACHAAPPPTTTHTAAYDRLAESIFQSEVQDWKQHHPGLVPSREQMALFGANAELEAEAQETRPLR